MATPNGIAVIARNISKRKAEELDNHQNRDFLQTLVDHLPLLIYAKSARPKNFGELVIWNKAAERITGYTEEEVLGHVYGDAFPPELAAHAEIDSRVLDEAPPVQRIHPFPRRDGA